MTSVDSPPRSERTSRRPDRPRRPYRLLVNVAIAVAFLWAGFTVDVDFGLLLDAPATAVRIFGLMFFPPDLGELVPALEGMLESIQIAWIGTVIGAVFSLPLGLMAAKNIGGRALPSFVRQILNALRTIPELVLAIIFIPLAGLGPFAGTIAIGLSSIGTLGKWTSEVVEGVDPGPVEAADATGSSQLATMRWGVIPQVMPEIVAFWLYRFEINIRASAILGVVGAGGIGGLLSQFLTYRRWASAGMLFIVVIVATLLIDFISGMIRRRIIRGPDAGEDAETLSAPPEVVA